MSDAGEKKGLRVAYDYLVFATGATHSYFGHDEFARLAPGLKRLADAESLRNHILTSFENAEAQENPERRKALMTFVMVGAGPTGVEMASAIAVNKHVIDQGRQVTYCSSMRRGKPCLRPTKGRYRHGACSLLFFDNETKAYQGKRALIQLDSEGSISVYGYIVVQAIQRIRLSA